MAVATVRLGLDLHSLIHACLASSVPLKFNHIDCLGIGTLHAS